MGSYVGIVCRGMVGLVVVLIYPELLDRGCFLEDCGGLFAWSCLPRVASMSADFLCPVKETRIRKLAGVFTFVKSQHILLNDLN